MQTGPKVCVLQRTPSLDSCYSMSACRLGLANMLLSNPRLKHNILVRAYPLSMNLSLVFAILCNCFLLADYSDFSNSPRAHSALSTTLTVMGAILVAVSTFRLIGYFLVWIPAWLSQPPKAKSRKDKHVAFSELKPELHDYRRKNRAKGGQASIQPTTSSDSQVCVSLSMV